MNRIVKTDQPGFVLPAAILGLVVVGALITGGIFLGGQESQVAVSTEYSTEAFLAAERGLAEAVGGRYRKAYARVAGDAIYAVSRTEQSGGVQTRYTLRFKSLGSDLFFVESTGDVLSGGRFAGAIHRTGMIVRPSEGGITVRAAIQSMGTVDVSGNGWVSGIDHTPPDWEERCDEPGASVPGLLTTGASYTSGAGDAYGNPSIAQDTTMTPANFNVGGFTYDDLVDRADYTIGGGNVTPAPTYNVDGTCNIEDSNNWGEATGPCSNHFPIVHATGDLNLKDYGQGILIVDGNFLANGGARFHGLVVVLGRIRNGGGNGGVRGAIVVLNNGTEDEYEINGSGFVHYSRCVLNTAVRHAHGLSQITPIVERNWVDLTATGAATY